MDRARLAVWGCVVGCLAGSWAYAADVTPTALEADLAATGSNAYLGRTRLDARVQAGQLEDAEFLAGALVARFPDDALLWAQVGYLKFMVRDYAEAQVAFGRAQQGVEWTPEQRRNLAYAEADSATAAGDMPGAVTAIARLMPTSDASVRLRLGRAQLAAHDRPAALQSGRWVSAYAKEAETQAAGDLLQLDALKPGEDPRGTKLLNLGYAYLRQGEDAKGLAAFEQGFGFGVGRAFHFADAAYAAKRTAQNAAAGKYFRFAIDLGEDDKSLTPQQQFGYRREIEVMERRWGVLLGTPYHAGALNIWQGGLEAYWQPPVIGYRNGRTLQFFVRSFMNFRNGVSGPVGWDTTQQTLGIRWKPLASQNISLTAERVFAVGRLTQNDWLFRIGYSMGDGTDLRVDRKQWQDWQVFAEGAYFLNAQRLLIGTEVRYGVALPIPPAPSLTVYPHALVAVDYDSASTAELVDAIGAGLSLRGWFGADRYHAPSSYLELTAQYRFADAERGQGPAVRVTLSF